MSTSPSRKKWQCPGCRKVYSVPSTSGLVLCPDCQRSADQSPPSAAPTAPVDFDTIVNNAPPSKRSDSRSPRYPNLNLYLTLLSLVAKIVLIGAIVIAFALVVMQSMGLVATITAHPISLREAPGLSILISLITTLVIILPAIIGYVAQMGFVEFVRVMIDIEKNTRESAERI